MQYILSEKEYNKLVPKESLKELETVMRKLIQTYQQSDKCVPNVNCLHCPLSSANNKHLTTLCEYESYRK